MTAQYEAVRATSLGQEGGSRSAQGLAVRRRRGVPAATSPSQVLAQYGPDGPKGGGPMLPPRSQQKVRARHLGRQAYL
jgi:hypothetical protein